VPGSQQSTVRLGLGLGAPESSLPQGRQLSGDVAVLGGCGIGKHEAPSTTVGSVPGAAEGGSDQVFPTLLSGSGSFSGDDPISALDNQNLEARAARLMATKEEVIDLLLGHDQAQWASRLAEVLPSDVTALRRLLPGRGDADDFHVAYLTTRNGRWLHPTDEAAVNERFSLLRAVLFMDARALVKAHQAQALSRGQTDEAR